MARMWMVLTSVVVATAYVGATRSGGADVDTFDLGGGGDGVCGWSLPVELAYWL